VQPLFGLAPRITVAARQTVRTVNEDLLGQAVWYSWQAYFWDFARGQTDPQAFGLFAAMSPGVVGHYPGVGVITHDFHWKRLIGPLAERSDPTPRESNYDTPLALRFGPDEYGRLVEEFRTRTGRQVAGSIQVNVVNASAEDAADWVEYMNAPNNGSNPGGGVDWAARRAANGHPAPYGIRYWEFGNEPHFTASGIGHLTAWEYVARIREFAPLMKSRDPSIVLMAYVNPFPIGDGALIGSPAPDPPAGPAPDGSEREALTWTQAVIRHAGPSLDMLYFHWYGGWTQTTHGYEHMVTSMYTGLVPLLDRVIREVDTYAPADARARLRRIAIPEWNAYGGWFNPVSAGTAMLGAIADSRVLHVLMRRPEVVLAQHLMLAAPYPDPPVGGGGDRLDVRPGYAAILGRSDGAETLGTALYEVSRLWARALRPTAVRADVAGMPASGEVSLVDATALLGTGGRDISVIVTNAAQSELTISVSLESFTPSGRATLLRVAGRGPLDNNTWSERGRVTMTEESLSVDGPTIPLRLPPYSVSAVLLEGALQ
jgi:alpha-L-arabinofuranosidase